LNVTRAFRVAIKSTAAQNPLTTILQSEIEAAPKDYALTTCESRKFAAYSGVRFAA
jgi:hypothetical protein